MMVEIKEKEKKEMERMQQELAVKKVKEDLQMMWLKDKEHQLEEQRQRDEVKKIREQEKVIYPIRNFKSECQGFIWGRQISDPLANI